MGGKLEVVKPYTTDARAHIDIELADRAVDYVKKHANGSKPFFLYLPWTRPHYPNVTTAEFNGKSRIGPYGDCVTEMDYNVGRVLDALKQAGIEDNTIVVFASDNGPSPAINDIFNAGSSGPFRGELGDPLEGSLRTVGMIRWPGKIKPRVSNEMFSEMDFFPTLAKFAGAKIPTDRPIDGIDQSAYLLGQQDNGRRENMLTFIGDQLVAVRGISGAITWWTSSLRELTKSTPPAYFPISRRRQVTRWSITSNLTLARSIHISSPARNSCSAR